MNDPRVPRRQDGVVAAVDTTGTMLVDIGGGALVPVEQDVRGAIPLGTKVVLLFSQGSYVLAHAVGAPGSVQEDVRIVRSPDAPPPGEGWEEASIPWVRVVNGVPELWLQVATMPPPPVGGALTLTSVLSDNWNNDANRWGGDVPKQGRYGYGLRSGFWFFRPDEIAAVHAGSWSRITVKVTRDTGGGVYRAVPVTLWTHDHPTKPDGAPTRANPAEVGAVAPGAELVWDTTDPRWLSAFTIAAGFAAHRDTGEYVVFGATATITFHP